MIARWLIYIWRRFKLKWQKADFNVVKHRKIKLLVNTKLYLEFILFKKKVKRILVFVE